MMFEKRKKGIIAIIALLLAAFIAGGVFSVSAKYTSKLSTANTYVQVGLKLDPNYESAADSQWRMVSPVNGQAMPSVTPPARDGYIFTGYYSEDGTAGHEQSDANRYYKNDGTSYKNWDASCNVLYAGWEGTFKVTFDAGTNGGTIKDSTEIKTELYAKNGESVLYSDNTTMTTVPAPGASCDGMRFDGWFTEADGGAEVINENGTLLASTLYTDASCKWNLTSSITLYAQYSAYKVTFDAETNGGIIKDTTKTELYAKNGSSILFASKKADVTASAPLAEYSDKDHYYFDGWYNAASGGIKKIDYDGTVLLPFSGLTDDTTVLYAQYKPYTYLVTFDKNAPTGTTSGSTPSWSKECDDTTQTPLSTNGFIRSGYNFAGWMTDKDGTTTQFVNKQPVNVDDLINAGAVVSADSDHTKKNITLYAKWATVHTVTFKNMTGSSGTMVATYYELGGILYKDNTTFTLDKVVDSMPTVNSADESRTGLSYWTTTKTGKVGTGSTATPAPVVISAGEVVPNTYTDENGQSFTITGTSAWTLNSNITLYAVWYTVNYYKDTGIFTTSDAYTELEYIASTTSGKQGINTGYAPQDQGFFIWPVYYLKLEYSLRPTEISSSPKYFYFCTQLNVLRNYYFNFQYKNGNASWNVGESENLFSHTVDENERVEYLVDCNTPRSYNKTITINKGEFKPDPSGFQGWLGNNTIKLFRGDNESSALAMRLYYFNIYDGDNRTNPARLFVPAMSNSSGRLGLYNKSGSGNVFYDNAYSTTVDFITEKYNQVFLYGETSGVLNGYNVTGNSNDGKPKEGYTNNGRMLDGWSLNKTPNNAQDIVIETGVPTPIVNPTAVFAEYIKGTVGELHVDLYTHWQSAGFASKAVFRNQNKSTEYVYVEPAAEEETE